MTGLAITQCPSPNCGARRSGFDAPDMIVLHYTAMHSAKDAIETLSNPELEVSAHYVISRDGTVSQLVNEQDRAWHAGAGLWAGCSDINSRSIGIELDNDGFSPFSARLMDSLELLMPDIMRRWSIPAHQVIAHSDLAPTRKFDPGPRFDWLRLSRQGLAIWPTWPAQPGHVSCHAPIETSLTRIGYGVEQFGLAPCLSAFRMRYGFRSNGPATQQECAAAANLAERFGVDPKGGAA